MKKEVFAKANHLGELAAANDRRAAFDKANELGEQALAENQRKKDEALAQARQKEKEARQKEKERDLAKARQNRESIIARAQEMEKLQQELEMWKRMRKELTQKQQNMVEKFLESKKKFTHLKERSLSIAATPQRLSRTRTK